jgi:hypothetical protein
VADGIAGLFRPIGLDDQHGGEHTVGLRRLTQLA